MNPPIPNNRERQLDHDIGNLLSLASIEQKEAIFSVLKKINSEVDEILAQGTTYKALQPIGEESVSKDPNYMGEFLKTFISIGINNKHIGSSEDLNMLQSGDDFSLNLHNFSKNYKYWIGKKLFLSEEEIEQKNVEDIDNFALKYLNYAIKHVEKVLTNFSGEEQKLLKSEYFNQIHNGDNPKTVFNLIKFWNHLRMRKNKLKNESSQNPRDGINYDKIITEIEKASFEIQRILGLAMLYIDREKNQNYQHTIEDIDFITKKLQTIVSNPTLNDGVFDAENPLYHLVNTKKMYWGKQEGGKYFLQEEQTPETPNEMKMDKISLLGKTRNFKKKPIEVTAYHIASRMKKGPFSSVDKIIRKELNSFNQIMDHKGFIFVVNDFSEGKKLLQIIENELGTLQSSWIEEPVFMSNSGNENTDSQYNSIKGIIKIPYKGKLIRDFFNTLEIHFKNNSELLKRINTIKHTCSQNKTEMIQAIEKLLDIESEENEKLKAFFRDLKAKFYTKEYNIELEIQIFDIQNYMKAEIDKNSPAHHDYYKDRQVTYTIPKYFPPSVYGIQNIRGLISSRIQKN